MALSRSGGFGGGGLDPFGGGSFGGLGAYDIGADLADMELYLTETRWGNGEIGDDEYLAALKKSLEATDPNTHRRDVAQNRLTDAEYRIGRSKADKKGLDELIAFDQAALAKMKPDNLRYRDVDESLKAELAQRRSRDYGKLVVEYNAGKTTTKSLLAWVKNVQRTIDKDDPDFDNWQSVVADLDDRLKSEKDQKVYQDFQTGKMKPEAFLAYLTGRRDEFERGSPQYDDWKRRVQDAKKQVKDTAQAKVDAAFFNAYEEGKKSDAAYLGYLKKRIGGMEPDDPDKPSWQHRMNQAAFSLAEDKLRFDVEKGRAPVSRLISFYRDYRATLNPGSAEWRQITRSLDSLARYGSGGGGGGGGGGRSRGGGGGGGGSAGAGSALPAKVIKGYSIESAMQLMTVNPYADKKSQKTAKEFFDLNYSSLENARLRGDDVFLFFDPRKPGATVVLQNPDGSPYLDANGQPVLARGSAYLPVSDNLFADFSLLKADYHAGLAELALFNHDAAGYADQLRQAYEAQDKARLVGSQATQKMFDADYDLTQKGIDAAMRTGDWALAANLSREMAARLRQELDENPMLDDTRRDKLESLGEKLADNPLIPDVDPFSPDRQIGGALNAAMSSQDRDGNFTKVVLNEGWHHMLDKADDKGGAAWGLVYDPVQDGTWEQTHVPVSTSYGAKIVKGEASKRTAGIQPDVFGNTDEGMIRAPMDADYVTFTDENGQVVKVYSIDGGRTWVRSLSGMAPQIEVTKPVHLAGGGGGFLVDDSGEPVFERAPDGSWTFVGKPGDIAWYGTSAAAARRNLTTSVSALPTFLSDALMGGLAGAFGNTSEFGAPGQQMQLITTGVDGGLNLISDNALSALEKEFLERPRAKKPYKPPTTTRIGPDGEPIEVDVPDVGADTKVISGLLGRDKGWLNTFLGNLVIPGLGLGGKPVPGPSKVKPSFGGFGGPRLTPPTAASGKRAGSQSFRPPALKATVAPPSYGGFGGPRLVPPPPKPRGKPAIKPPVPEGGWAAYHERVARRAAAGGGTTGHKRATAPKPPPAPRPSSGAPGTLESRRD